MVKVLIVDDSRVAREVFRRAFTADPDLEVVGTAEDAYRARELIAACRPDVLTLDVNMPGMDGLTFLGKLMEQLPLPVVVVSSATVAGSEQALRALELGAVDIFAKPRAGENLQERLGALARRVKHAATAKVTLRTNSGAPRPATADQLLPLGHRTDRVLALGASTGGTTALETVLRTLPLDAPPTVVTQHMPATFTAHFADRLDGVVPMRVREASDGDDLEQGLVLLAPGDRHLRLRAARGGYRVILGDDEPINHHRPAVDAMFVSVAEIVGGRAIGALLTGMGRDGADGLLRMREAGSPTAAQDEATSVVYGMPRAAAENGAARRILPLEAIGPHLMEVVRRGRRTLHPTG